MDEFKNNKLFYSIIIFTILNFLFFFASGFIIHKTTDKVIEKLQKEYSPSPYGPGLDPDKVEKDNFKKQKAYLQKEESEKLIDNAIWRQEWEKDRGFNPEQ